MRRGQDELMRSDGYVTAAEVAEATGQQLSTVHRAIEADRIPGGKVGAAWYVDIHAYAAKFSKTGPEAGMRGRLDVLTSLVGKPAEGKIAKAASSGRRASRPYTAPRQPPFAPPKHMAPKRTAARR